jgi:hypothetical protein
MSHQLIYVTPTLQFQRFLETHSTRTRIEYPNMIDLLLSCHIFGSLSLQCP